MGAETEYVFLILSLESFLLFVLTAVGCRGSIKSMKWGQIWTMKHKVSNLLQLNS